MKNFYSHLFTVSLFVVLLTSCARNISSDDYVASTVGEVSTTWPGIVQNVREVFISSHDELDQNNKGLLAGGIGGGLLGSSIGKGKGNLITTAAGAISGAVGGAILEKNLKQQKAFEYVVSREDGSLMTVVQGKNILFNPGQPVYIIVSQMGRSRLIAR